MFEDVKFDLDFSENQAKKETPKIQVANKSKIESSISSKAGATQGTQKSIFSLNDLFGDDSEILDISLNFDKKNKEEKGSYGRKSTHSARDSHLRTGPSTDQQSKFYDSTRDSHLRAGTSRDQQSKSYDSTRESQLRAGSRVGSSRNQQSRYYDSIGDSANDKSFQEGIKRGIEKPPGNTPKRRFPGPAGLLPIESTEQAVPDLQCSQENADENYVWIKALDDQGMQWGDPDSLISKYNVGHIKQNKKPGTSIRMPILVARIKNLDKNCPDHICSLRDPNGEVGGSIHRDVIDQFGSEIQVGSILVLTNVIVLMTRTQYVNITLNNMVSIYRPYNVTHIRTVNWNDVEVTAEKKERIKLICPLNLRRSCLTNLLEYLEEMTRLVDEGHNVDVVYLDFAKAFDKVAPSRLMAKCRSLGIVNEVAAWIEAWLEGRKQRVVLNGSVSSWLDVTSGVPQGSVLGPILFVIFINDIDTVLDNEGLFLSKFADDTKACRIVDTEEGVEKLQKDLDSFSKWASDWQMQFNVGKCKILHFGRTNPRNTYVMDGKELGAVEEEKDLGVLVHQSLKPSVQIAAAAKKANQVLGQILRAFTYRDKTHFVKLFTSRVRCHLEYAIQAYSPWLGKDIDVLEAVQRRAIRQVRGLHGSYEEKLRQCGLTLLVDRRVRGDLIQTFKIVNQIDDLPIDTFFTMAGDRHTHATRNTVIIGPENEQLDSKNLVKVQANYRYDMRRNFFSQRVVDNWNILPNSVKNAADVNSFKNLYDAWKK